MARGEKSTAMGEIQGFFFQDAGFNPHGGDIRGTVIRIPAARA
jgi:hypothetical protein